MLVPFPCHSENLLQVREGGVSAQQLVGLAAAETIRSKAMCPSEDLHHQLKNFLGPAVRVDEQSGMVLSF